MSRVEANMGGHFGTFKSKKDRILGTDFAFEIGKKKKRCPMLPSSTSPFT